MALNAFNGWALSTLLCFLVNKSDSSDTTSQEADDLSVTETDIGTPIPVVMGRTLIKKPLITYFGGFRADIYTEEYASHAKFSAWPIILTSLLAWVTTPVSGAAVKPHVHKFTGTGGNSGGPVTISGVTTPEDTPPLPIKETVGPKILMMLAQWILAWLINGRNLKTTVQKGFKYYLGYQQVIAWSGEGARIRGVYLAENKVWAGDEARENHADAPFVISVNNGDLFGGVDESGGFIGDIRCYLGGKTQPADGWIEQQMQANTVQAELRGLTSAYRPFATIVVPTAYVGKRATIPETWVDYQWQPNRLGLGGIDEDANPSEILYEAHVNKQWGLCEDADTLDIDALKAMGATLKNEGVGLTVKLTSKAKASNLIDAICEHVNAVRYIDPITGKLTYKLIRDDYDTSKLTVLNTSNVEDITFTRLDWQETVSEIAVGFSDRDSQYETSTLSDSDPANIEINEGRKTSKSLSYAYFTKPVNALWAAQREAKQQGYPLATASITGNRTISHLRMGDVVVLNWIPYGIKNMLMRVTSVDLGDFIEGKVNVELIEDVFGLAKTAYGFSDSTAWQPELKYPTGVSNYRFMEMPYEIIPDYDTYVFGMAAIPSADTQKWNIWRNDNINGWERTTGMVKWTPCGLLVYNYAEFTNAIDLTGIEISDFGGLSGILSAVLSTGAPDTASARSGAKLFIIGNEIMAYSSVSQLSNGNWRVQGLIRGCFDTIPEEHVSGEQVFFLASSYYSNVTTGGPVCKRGNVVSELYNITTATVTTEETFDYTKIKEIDTVRRSERPNPPGMFRMSNFGTNDTPNIDSCVGDVSFSWKPRNKEFSFGIVSQDDINDFFTGQEIAAPDSQTYVVRIYSGNTKIAEREVNTLNYAYSYAQRCLDSANMTDKTTVEVYAKSSTGLLSLYCQNRQFEWRIPGLIDACESESAALARFAEWKGADRVVIPAGTHNINEVQIMFADMPILLIGNIVTNITVGAILAQEGKYILPNKSIIVDKNGTPTVTDLQTGFTFWTAFIEQSSGGRNYYKWDGNIMLPTTIQ